MNPSQGLLTRLRGRLRHFFLDPEGAEVAIEFSSEAVVGARVESKRGQIQLRALASAPLADGVFLPALDDPGFVDREKMRDAVKSVLARIGATPAVRAALVVPDVVARFRLFTPDEVGTELKKREAVVGFRMQKLLPFPPIDARVASAFSRSVSDPVLGIGFSASVLGAYEEVGQAFGLDVGSVETSSMALLRGLPEGGDALLVRHDPSYLTLTLIRDGWPVSIRSFDASVAGRAEEGRREIASTAVFWRDRLAGQHIEDAFVHASDAWFDELSGGITAGFGCAPKRVKPPLSLNVPGTPASVQRSATPALTLLGAAH